MSAATPCLRAVILTEDSGQDAHAVLQAFLKKAFQILVPECGTHRVAFAPRPDVEQKYVHGNAWLGDGPRRQGARLRTRFELVDLLQFLATQLADENTFVCFHYDADVAWSRRAASQRPRLFDQRIRQRVQQLLQDSSRTGESSSASIARLLEIVPHYSIEAWAYQNLAEAERLCTAMGRPVELVELLESWRQDRTRIDEVLQIKQVCALKDMHNKTLAESAWPANTVYDTGTSFAGSVDRMLQCDALCLALQATIA